MGRGPWESDPEAGLRWGWGWSFVMQKAVRAKVRRKEASIYGIYGAITAGGSSV